jgi:hypothetical protein
VSHAGVAAGLFCFTRLVMSGGLTMVVGGCLVIERGVMVVRRLTAFATDLGHVFAVAADGLPALATGLGGFLRIELVSRAALVSGATAFAGDPALLFRIHARETSRTLTGHDSTSNLMREKQQCDGERCGSS